MCVCVCVCVCVRVRKSVCVNLFGLVWFGLVLYHIYHCWLVNVKSNIYYVYNFSTHFLYNIFKQAGIHFLHTQLNAFTYFY